MAEPARLRRLWWLLAAILLVRLLGAASLPMMDTTEPRYAEISRMMVERQDWLTPWFDEDTPFWGKPPLSIWAQALAIQWFGANDLAPRLPSWLLAFVLAWLTAQVATRHSGAVTGPRAALVLVSMALPFAAAGAVMTDMFLALGVMLSLSAFALLLMGAASIWRWLFFIGLAVSMLAKGPVGIVLTGLPIALWLVLAGSWRDTWHLLPWIRGSLLTLLLVLPWYLAAEARTPGFLDYFFVGEHVRRFTDPKWAGDLYGRAHQEPQGMIWLYWLAASFPWGLVLLWRGWRWLMTSARAVWRPDPVIVLLLGWMLAPMLLFTFASNILWTYVLPGLPAAALLLVVAPGSATATAAPLWRWLPLLMPALAVVALPVVLQDASGWRSERANLAAVQQDGAMPDDLMYLRKVPFSARYYGAGVITALTDEQAQNWWRSCERPCYLAVPRREPNDWQRSKRGAVEVLSRSRNYIVLVQRLSASGSNSGNESSSAPNAGAGGPT